MTAHGLAALLLQNGILQLVADASPVNKTVIGILMLFSLLSWTIIFSKLSALRRARNSNQQFLLSFRRAKKLEEMNTFAAQFR